VTQCNLIGFPVFPLQIYKEAAKPPEKLNKTRGIGVIKAPPDLVATIVADEYEAWDDSIKDLKTLTSERDPETGALVEIIWSRYCLRAFYSVHIFVSFHKGYIPFRSGRMSCSSRCSCPNHSFFNHDIDGRVLCHMQRCPC
jgi:hypothetical protein